MEFESKLKITQEKLDILLEDAKAGAGGGDITLVEKVNDMHDKMNNIRDILDEADRLQQSTNGEIDNAALIAKEIETTIGLANSQLDVNSIKMFGGTSVKLFLILGSIRAPSNRRCKSPSTCEGSVGDIRHPE